MISWKLWQALHTPFVAHPLYQRWGVWRESSLHSDGWWGAVQDHLYKRERLWWTLSALAAVVVTILFGPGPLLMLFFGVPFLLTFVGIPVMLVFVGTFYGVVSALVISDNIANEQVQGRYTLLGLTPYGRAGATWALCSIAVQKTGIMKRIREFMPGVHVILGVILTFPLSFGLLIFLVAPADALTQIRFSSAVTFTVMMVVTILDYFQSANVGCLVGMIVPTYARGRGNARNLAISGFLSLQFATYLVIMFICFVFLPRFYAAMHYPLDATYALLCLLAFYAVREVLIVILWMVLALRLDAEFDELEAIANIGIGRPTVRIALPNRVTNLIQRARNAT